MTEKELELSFKAKLINTLTHFIHSMCAAIAAGACIIAYKMDWVSILGMAFSVSILLLCCTIQFFFGMRHFLDDEKFVAELKSLLKQINNE